MQPHAERIADAALARWRCVGDALSPIIGNRGVLALFQRSVHLRHLELPSPARAEAHERPDDAFAALHAALLALTPEMAAAADIALRQTFIDLLGRLIGTALTQRLIGFMQPPSAGPARSASASNPVSGDSAPTSRP